LLTTNHTFANVRWGEELPRPEGQRRGEACLAPTNDQKSICALNFTKRGDKTDCGVSHVPVGEYVWL